MTELTGTPLKEISWHISTPEAVIAAYKELYPTATVVDARDEFSRADDLIVVVPIESKEDIETLFEDGLRVFDRFRKSNKVEGLKPYAQDKRGFFMKNGEKVFPTRFVYVSNKTAKKVFGKRAKKIAEA